MTEKKNVKRRKKEHLQVLFSFLDSVGDVGSLCHYDKDASVPLAGGALPCGGLSDSSTRELMDEGSSLPFEKPASWLLELNLHIHTIISSK